MHHHDGGNRRSTPLHLLGDEQDVAVIAVEFQHKSIYRSRCGELDGFESVVGVNDTISQAAQEHRVIGQNLGVATKMKNDKRFSGLSRHSKFPLRHHYAADCTHGYNGSIPHIYVCTIAHFLKNGTRRSQNGNLPPPQRKPTHTNHLPNRPATSAATPAATAKAPSSRFPAQAS